MRRRVNSVSTGLRGPGPPLAALVPLADREFAFVVAGMDHRNWPWSPTGLALASILANGAFTARISASTPWLPSIVVLLPIALVTVTGAMRVNRGSAQVMAAG